MKAIVVIATLATTAFADDQVAEDQFAVSVSARVGSVSAPFYTNEHPVVRSELLASSFVIDGRVRVHPQWSVGARLPFATSAVAEPAGSYVADNTLGNPLAFAEYDRMLRSSTVLRARASLGLPLAGSGDPPSLVRNRVVVASAALDGWRSSELYQPGTMPLVLQAIIDERRPRWRARGGVKLATFVRVSDVGLDAPSVGFVPSVELEAAWRPRHWLSVGVSAHAVFLVVPPTEPMRDVRSGRAHLGVVPKVELARGRASLALEVLLALAGPLDDTIGLGATVAWHH